MFGLGKKKNSTIDCLDNYELPSFSLSVINLLSKLRDPESSIADISYELEIDPGLHVRALKTVNSVAFGLSRKVSNMHHAVNLLGRARIESLVLTVAVKNNLADEKTPDWFDMRHFWQSAARRAAFARGLAMKLHPETETESFTVGLLQDMAVPVIARVKASRYQNLYAEWNLLDEKSNLAQIEQKTLKLDHASIGAQMAESWGFPENLVRMIGNHHSTEGSTDIPISVQIVSLLKGNPNVPIENIASTVEEIFNLDPSVFKQLAAQAQIDANELAEALR